MTELDRIRKIVSIIKAKESQASVDASDHERQALIYRSEERAYRASRNISEDQLREAEEQAKQPK